MKENIIQMNVFNLIRAFFFLSDNTDELYSDSDFNFIVLKIYFNILLFFLTPQPMQMIVPLITDFEREILLILSAIYPLQICILITLL